MGGGTLKAISISISFIISFSISFSASMRRTKVCLDTIRMS
jgi:hypothetical protein